MFSSSFMFSGLSFKSLIRFEFIFIYNVRKVLISFCYMELSRFPSTTYWRDCLLSIVYFCFLYQRLIDKKYMSLFIYLFIYFFRAAPITYGGLKGRGQIGATAAGLYHSHSNAGSQLHLRPTPQLMAMLDTQAH